MIYTRIEDADRYLSLGSGLTMAVDFLRSPGLKEMPPGKYQISGTLLYASIEEPTTKLLPSAPFESHREYTDVQMTLCGEELIGWAPLSSLRPRGPWPDGKDTRYYDGSGRLLRCNGGIFAVFFPEDGHQPCVAPDKPTMIRKIVIKIHKSLLL